MVFLLNLIFGLLAFFFVRYAMLEAKATPVIALVVGALMGIVVFLLNLGARVV